MAPTKALGRTWREVKQQKKKWKEEKMFKKHLKALDEPASKTETIVEKVEVNVVEKKTCSLAVPGSIMDNAQSAELRSYLAGQIARAACIYSINEVIVFDDVGETTQPTRTGQRQSCTQFARILQYLECPQYLRKFFFPMHKDLEYAGVINPLDAPHHFRQHESSLYREGITTDKPVKKYKDSTFVNVGLLQEVLVDKKLTPGLRVTVKLNSSHAMSKSKCGTVVPPDQPFGETDTYWGYTVRIAKCLSDVFSKCPYPEGYDLTIGTSDKGQHVNTLKKKNIKQYKHCLIVFGGLHGIEAALENDESLPEDDPSVLFDYYLNTCPAQGSRTIRTEEAVLITLAELRRKIFFTK